MQVSNKQKDSNYSVLPQDSLSVPSIDKTQHVDVVLPIEKERKQTKPLPGCWSDDILKSKEKILHQKQKITESSDLKNISAVEMDMELTCTNHLMFVIHGIGKHQDFIEHDQSWDGVKGGLSGGLFDFKLSFEQLLYRRETNLKQKYFPLNLKIESIEWHENLREDFEIEHILNERLAPDGVASIRNFITETLLDGFLYLSPKFAQRILNTVCKQLNEKYRIHCQTHPGFADEGNKGRISLFAHSLGTMIILDLLTRSRKDVIVPKLDFEVSNLFCCGSPISLLRLLRGDMFDEKTGKILSQKDMNEKVKLLPSGIRFVNIIHPLDAISWKIAPLVSELDSTSLDLPNISGLEKLSLGDIFQKYYSVKEAELFNQVVDFTLPISRFENMMSLPSAISSHSTYWSNTSVSSLVLSVLVEDLALLLGSGQSLQKMANFKASIGDKLFKTVDLKDLRIAQKQRPVDFSMEIISLFSTSEVFYFSEVTEFQYDCVIFIQCGFLYLFEDCLERQLGDQLTSFDMAQSNIMVSYHQEEELSSKLYKFAGLGKNSKSDQRSISEGLFQREQNTSRTFEVVSVDILENEARSANNHPTVPRKPSLGLGSDKAVSAKGKSGVIPEVFSERCLFRAPSWEEAKNWFEKLQHIQNVNKTLRGNFRQSKSKQGYSEQELESKLFGSDYFGVLEKRNESSWTKTWDKGYYVLRSNVLSSYKFGPSPESTLIRCLDVSKVRALKIWKGAGIFKFCFRYGDCLKVRVSKDNIEDFEESLAKILEMLPAGAEISYHLHEEFESRVVVGYEVHSEGFAVYLIRAKFSMDFNFTTEFLVRRRNREIKEFHAALTKELTSHEKGVTAGEGPPPLSALPSSGLTRSLDPNLLNKRVVMLNGFFRDLSSRRDVVSSDAWKDFFDETRKTVTQKINSTRSLITATG
eukprot:snap_masked-scaffold_60-processed-gene-0.44-mRNA-1 protein AED:1.00 eAED:1.00 QI:0/-1/0/0/-1/1/1/0/923